MTLNMVVENEVLYNQTVSLINNAHYMDLRDQIDAQTKAHCGVKRFLQKGLG
jgi:hypothetical protein